MWACSRPCVRLRPPSRMTWTCPLSTHRLSTLRSAQVEPEAAPAPSAPTPVKQPEPATNNPAPSGAAAPLPAESQAYTLSQMYLPKRKVQPFVQLDHTARRRDKEINEIAEAAKRVGMTRQQVLDNVASIESLLPDLAPNLDKMKASDWVKLLKDPKRVATMLIMLKSYYPSANVSRIIARNPKILLQDLTRMEEDAKKVREMVGERLSNLDAVVEECPDLMKPAQFALSLNNLQRWFPAQDSFELLQKNPGLLNNIEEADLAPDPTYGWESNFFNTGSISETATGFY